MTSEPDTDEWIARFVQSSLDEDAVTRFVEVVDTEILRTLPEVAADPILVADLHRSTRSQWLAFLSSLAQPGHDLVLPPQASDLARSLARRGMEARVLLRVYLNAHHGVFEYLSDALGEVDDSRREALLHYLWPRADRWMDESVERLIETFYEERQRRRDGSARRRAEMIESLVGDAPLLGVNASPGDAASRGDRADVSAVLGYDLSRRHVSWCAWETEGDDRSAERLQRVSERIADVLGASSTLFHVAGSSDVWAWASVGRGPDSAVVEGLAELLSGAQGLSVGVAACGPDGFRSSLREARAGQRLALAAPLAPSVIDYREVDLLCLSIGDEEALRRLVSRELGGFGADARAREPLSTTVLTYLSCRMNVEATAERLYVHGNTVRHRLARAEEALGRPLADRTRQLELALQYVAYFGWAAAT